MNIMRKLDTTCITSQTWCLTSRDETNQRRRLLMAETFWSKRQIKF